jgi:hypothetical protein
MASKKYSDKPCSYCDGQARSGTADHVVAGEFFLVNDRNNLPKVPPCKKCNGLKSKLETYALTVLPLASRHCDSRIYSEQNIERRLKKNNAVRRQLSLKHSGVWERHGSGLLLPIMSVDVDEKRIQELFSFITKGLFVFHWSEPLNAKWYPDVTIIKPYAEKFVFETIINAMGRPLELVRGNLGRGTFVYEGVRGAKSKWFSLWQFAIFGGLQFGNASTPRASYTRISAVTRPDMSRVPFTVEEIGALTGAVAQSGAGDAIHRIIT